MKTIILTTRKLLNPHARQQIPHFINLLAHNVKTHPGFLHGRSFWNNNKSMLYTITEWETEDSWIRWYNSPIREITVRDLPNNVIHETHETINQFEHAVEF